MIHYLILLYSYEPVKNNYSSMDYFLSILIILILMSMLFIVPYIKAKRSKFTFVDELLLLMAHVIKADNKVSAKETKFAESLLLKEFGPVKSKEYLQKLNALLKRDYSIKKVLKIIDYKESKPVKIQLLNNLIKITIVDGYLTNSELKVLTEICKGLSILHVRLVSMLSMYSYTTESAHKRTYNKSRAKITPDSKIKNAFKILEIDERTSDKLIKKAYRKLVVLYHPDKISHLDDGFKLEAKDKFLKINEAYELIKSKRGFK